MSFDAVWRRSCQIQGQFSPVNCLKLYEAAAGKHHMIEVGVDQGLSASILMGALRENGGGTLLLVDIWEMGHPIYLDNYNKVMALVREFWDLSISVRKGYSVEVAGDWPQICDFIHIDANHLDKNPHHDCEAWLPKLVSGGIACFHDYERAEFPAVKDAVDLYTKGWEDLGVWETLAIRRKP